MHSEHVHEIVLNKQKALNSLDQDMVDGLHEMLVHWQGKDPRVVLISGAGEKAFCAGGDIVSIYKGLDGSGDPETPRSFFAREYIVDNGLTTMDQI